MENINGLFVLRNYGKIIFHIGEVMDKRGISRNKLCTLTGIRFEVADRFYKGNIERLDVDILARICCVLNCNVGDLIEYVNDD